MKCQNQEVESEVLGSRSLGGCRECMMLRVSDATASKYHLVYPYFAGAAYVVPISDCQQCVPYKAIIRS